MSITGKTSLDEVLEVAGEGEVVEMNQEIYQMIRWIIKGTMSNPDANEWSVFDINAQINKHLAEGYELFDTHYLGETPTSYGMLYVLARWV